MPKSVINNDFEITENKWVVSILNTTRSLTEGHSAIVVEGIENDSTHIYKKSFIGQYDITSSSDESQSGCVNPTGYITKVKIFENEENKRNYKEEKFPAKSYYVLPILAKKMIVAIKEDEKRTKQAMENWSRESTRKPLILDESQNPITPLKYQKLGKNHLLVGFFGSTAAGDNCTGWCLEKLAIAGIGDGTGKPKPAIQSGQCFIL